MHYTHCARRSGPFRVELFAFLQQRIGIGKLRQAHLGQAVQRPFFGLLAAELARGQARIAQAADADGEVVALLHQVHDARKRGVPGEPPYGWFVSFAPADDPRFVVGIMLDNPRRSSDGSGGQSAAPLFSSIASWMLQRDRIPQSTRPTPRLVLTAG